MASTSRHTAKKLKIRKSDVYFVVLVLAWTALATIAGQFIVAQVLGLILGEQLSQPGWMLLYYILSYLITLALVIAVPPRLAKTYARQHQDHPTVEATKQLASDLSSTPTDLGVQSFPTFVDIGLAPVGYIVYIFFANILTAVMGWLFSWFNVQEEQYVGFDTYFVSNTDQIFAMLAIVFIAPIAEEIIMRGWLYGKVRHKLNNIPLAIILVSLLFAFLHGQWNVGISVFVLSVVLCTLREITGTIWAGMLLHILSNGIAFYLVYVI